jgi:hypothetical protein
VHVDDLGTAGEVDSFPPRHVGRFIDEVISDPPGDRQNATDSEINFRAQPTRNNICSTSSLTSR